MESLLLLIVVLALIYGFVVGAVKAFQRNWLLAILLVLFLFPAFMIWAFIEIFTGPVQPSAINVRIVKDEDIDRM